MSVCVCVCLCVCDDVKAKVTVSWCLSVSVALVAVVVAVVSIAQKCRQKLIAISTTYIKWGVSTVRQVEGVASGQVGEELLVGCCLLSVCVLISK